jgi:hypothetical protein
LLRNNVEVHDIIELEEEQDYTRRLNQLGHKELKMK